MGLEWTDEWLMKVSEVTGEKSGFSRTARAGRVVAALYELGSAIRNAASRYGTALLEVKAETVSACGLCGGRTTAHEAVYQTLHCMDCGAQIDRKQNGAAVAWMHADAVRETLVADYWLDRIAGKEARLSEAKDRLAKMAAGRSASRLAARTPIEAAIVVGSRQGE
jgi:hypothetical protein